MTGRVPPGHPSQVPGIVPGNVERSQERFLGPERHDLCHTCVTHVSHMCHVCVTYAPQRLHMGHMWVPYGSHTGPIWVTVGQIFPPEKKFRGNFFSGARLRLGQKNVIFNPDLGSEKKSFFAAGWPPGGPGPAFIYIYMYSHLPYQHQSVHSILGFLAPKDWIYK